VLFSIGLGLDLVYVLVSGYAHVFVLLSVVIVTLPFYTVKLFLCHSRLLYFYCNNQLLAKLG